MNLIWLLIIILVIAAVIGAPGVGPWHHGYGWGPTGGIGLILIILVVVLLLRGGPL